MEPRPTFAWRFIDRLASKTGLSNAELALNLLLASVFAGGARKISRGRQQDTRKKCARVKRLVGSKLYAR